MPNESGLAPPNAKRGQPHTCIDMTAFHNLNLWFRQARCSPEATIIKGPKWRALSRLSAHLISRRSGSRLLLGPVVLAPGAVQHPKHVAAHRDAQQRRHNRHGHPPVLQLACAETSGNYEFGRVLPTNSCLRALPLDHHVAEGLHSAPLRFSFICWVESMLAANPRAPQRKGCHLLLACPPPGQNGSLGKMVSTNASLKRVNPPPQGQASHCLAWLEMCYVDSSRVVTCAWRADLE